MKEITIISTESASCAKKKKKISDVEYILYDGMCKICWGRKRLEFVKSHLKLYI